MYLLANGPIVVNSPPINKVLPNGVISNTAPFKFGLKLVIAPVNVSNAIKRLRVWPDDVVK